MDDFQSDFLGGFGLNFTFLLSTLSYIRVRNEISGEFTGRSCDGESSGYNNKVSSVMSNNITEISGCYGHN